MMKNENEVRDILNAYGKLESECFSIAQAIVEGFEAKGYWAGDSHEVFEIYDGKVSITWQTHTGYGGYEDRGITFPLSYLWTSDWQAIERQKREAKKEAARSEKEAKEREQEEKRERQERATYEHLRSKFEQPSINSIAENAHPNLDKS